MPEWMAPAEAERYVDSICYMRNQRDAALREIERLRLVLDNLRTHVDIAMQDAAANQRDLRPPPPLPVTESVDG